MNIGITGTNAAGKGTAAKFFIRRGYDYYSLSDELRAILKDQGIKITRDSLTFMGNDIRKEKGAGYLAERVIKKLKGEAVIDSIRNEGEVEAMRKLGKFVLIAIDAPIETRFKRAQERQRGEDHKSFEEFKEQEAEEMDGAQMQQHLGKLMDMADVTIQNDGSVDELYAKLEEVLK